MARARLAFIFTWLLFMLFAQVPLLILYSAVGFEPYTIAFSEALTAILTVMVTTILLVKEDYDGKEIIRKK